MIMKKYKANIMAGFLALLIVITIFGLGLRNGHSAPQPRHIPLTAEQNKLLADIDAQLKQLAQQSQLVQAKGAGLVDAFAMTAGFSSRKYKLVDLAPGTYALEEVIDNQPSDKLATPQP